MPKERREQRCMRMAIKPIITPNRPKEAANAIMGNRITRMVYEPLMVGMVKPAMAVRDTTITMAEDTRPALTAA